VRVLLCVVLLAAPALAGFTRVIDGDIAHDGGWSYACAWADYDGNGWQDLFVANNNPNQGRNNSLYYNNCDGTFTRILVGPVVTDGGSTYGCTWGDLDNNGLPDLFAANYNEDNFLYLRVADSFVKLTSGRVVNDAGRSTGAAWADYDADGLLDLFVCNRDQVNFLYHNEGDSFTRVTAPPVGTDVANSSGCAWADYDNDGDLDLFVANVQTPNCLYRNDGAVFTKVTGDPVVSDTSFCNGASWGDIDNDGDLDLFVATGVLGTYHDLLYSNDGDGSFTKVTDSPVVNDLTWSGGGSWGDFDNDGDLDLFVGAYDGSNRLYTNDGAGNFTAVDTGAVVADGNYIMASTWVDYDRDGDLDLFTARNNYFGGYSALYRNDGFGNNWLVVTCVGSASNRNGIGARVRVFADIGGGATWQAREITTQSGGCNSAQSPSYAHFGLGSAATVESLEVRWPSGTVQRLSSVAANQYLTVTEPSGAVAERPTPGPSRIALGAAIVHGVLNLRSDIANLTSGIVLIDAAGRRALDLRPGPNDVSSLRPGVYFVHPSLQKVVIAK
jgi:hypothetical protein